MADLEKQAREVLAAELRAQGFEVIASDVMNVTAETYAVPRNIALRAMLAFRAAQPVEGPRYRHKKRGTEYTVIGIGRAQGMLSDDDPVVIYRGDAGDLWARHEAEFYDGRFEALTTPPAGRPEKEARPDREAVARIINPSAFRVLGLATTGGGAHRIAKIEADAALRVADAILALFPTDDGSREERMREALELSNAFIEETHPGQTALITRNRAALSDPQEQEKQNA